MPAPHWACSPVLAANGQVMSTVLEESSGPKRQRRNSAPMVFCADTEQRKPAARVDTTDRPQENIQENICFHELSARLVAEYDRCQAKNRDLVAENLRLREDLAKMASSLRILRESGAQDCPWGTYALSSDDRGTARDLNGDNLGKDELVFGSWTKRQIPELSRSSASLPDGQHKPVLSPKTDLSTGQDMDMSQPSEDKPIKGNEAMQNERDVARRDTDASVDPSQFLRSEGEDTVLGEKRMNRQASRLSAGSQVSQLELLACWDMTMTPAKRRSGNLITMTSPLASTMSNGSSSRLLSMGETDMRTGDKLKSDSWFSRFVMSPSSTPVLVWDIITCLGMLYDLIVIPLSAFNIDGHAILLMDFSVALIWSMDIVLNLFRGVDIGGVVELRPSKLALRYAKSWMTLDVVTVTIDWLALLSASVDDFEILKNLRARRLIRVLRVIRLLRLLKLTDKDRFKGIMSSKPEHFSVLFSILQLLAAIVVINHYVACVWYAIGNIGGVGHTWVEENFVEDKSTAYAYFTSFHWAMTQFTPASMEVVPENVVERIYTVCVIMLGLLMFSSFVSNMTNAIRYFQELNMEQNKQSSLLRQYLVQHRVSLKLTSSINSFLRARRAHSSKCLHERDVTALRSCPQMLLKQLHEEVFLPHMCSHPLFEQLRNNEEGAVSNICHLAVREKRVLVGEDLFRCGMPSKAMFFLTNGRASYFVGYEDHDPFEVQPGQWLCEMALWTSWEHRGRLTVSAIPAEFIQLEAEEFRTILSRSRSLKRLQEYAMMFCAKSAQANGGQENITDLWGDAEILKKIVQRVYDYDSQARTLNKMVMLWDGSENQWVHAFSAWHRITVAARRERNRPRFVQRMMFWR